MSPKLILCINIEGYIRREDTYVVAVVVVDVGTCISQLPVAIFANTLDIAPDSVFKVPCCTSTLTSFNICASITLVWTVGSNKSVVFFVSACANAYTAVSDFSFSFFWTFVTSVWLYASEYTRWSMK